MTVGFDHHASAYEEEIERAIAFAGQPHGRFVEAKARRLLSLARRRLATVTKALDVGCGTGLTIRHLVGEIAELHGVDLSEEMLARARDRVPDAVLRRYDGDELPYADHTFDLSFAVCVLHHVEPGRRSALLGEMARVTRPGGVVAVFEHNPWNPLTRKVVHAVSFDAGVRLLTRREVVAGLSQVGLTVTDAEYLLFTPWQALDGLERRLSWLPMGA